MPNQLAGPALLAGCLLAWAASTAVAQQSYPMLMSIEPIAAQIGQTSRHTIRSRYSTEGTYRVLISGDGVTGEVVQPEADAEGEPAKPSPVALSVHFTVSEDALPGVRDVRVATPTGVSTVAQLVIARDPVTTQTADSDPAAATPFTIPATLCGAIEKPEDVDSYRFTATAGQSVCFLVRCMTLQDRIHDLQRHADPILTLRHPTGSTLATSDNVFGADPFLCHTFSEDGEYTLELRDVRYQGNEFWQYAIEVSQRPHVQTIFPLAFTPDQTIATVAPLGPSGTGFSSTGLAPATLQLPDLPSEGIQTARLDLDGQGASSVQVVIDPGPLLTEVDDAGDSPETAQPISLPAGIQGRIGHNGDLDYYAFDAKQGEIYTFEVFARRVDSPLDSHLRLLDADGKQLQLNDDLRDGKRTSSDSRIEGWAVPADGRYLLEIRDLNLRGGDEFVYFLKASPATPHFRLYADTDKTLLTPGTAGVIFVRVERKQGFDGEIRLEVTGLPPGATATDGRILAGTHTDGCIVITADPAASPDVANVEIRGYAEPTAAEPASAVATIYQEIYQPGGGRGHWPVQDHAVAICQPGDILAVRVSPSEVNLKPGESVTLDVELERAPGFDSNVLLEVPYQHLNSVFGDPLPKGVTIDAAASNTLLTGGATKGKITLKAAADATLVESQPFAVMANVSINFVMKATYATPPLYLNVAP